MTAAPTLSEKLHEQGTGASILIFCCSVLQAESCGLEDSFDQAGQSTWAGIPAPLREAPEVYGALSLALLRKTPAGTAGAGAARTEYGYYPPAGTSHRLQHQPVATMLPPSWSGGWRLRGWPRHPDWNGIAVFHFHSCVS